MPSTEYCDYSEFLHKAQQHILPYLESDSETAPPVTVLLDGLSGAGKTEFSKELHSWINKHTDTPVELVAVDAYYQGWDGLEASEEITAQGVLDKDSPRYHCWDWYQDCVGEEKTLNSAAHRIVDGCGSITPGTVQAAHQRSQEAVVTLVLEAEEHLRKEGALQRSEGYAPWWDHWEKQAQSHISTLRAWNECEDVPISVWATRTQHFSDSAVD